MLVHRCILPNSLVTPIDMRYIQTMPVSHKKVLTGLKT